MAVIVNIKLTWSLFYVLSVSEFIIRTIRTPARRVCGSIYRYMPRSKVCIPDAMKFASYEQVPADVQDKLLKAYTDTDEE